MRKAATRSASEKDSKSLSSRTTIQDQSKLITDKNKILVMSGEEL